jgi:hypothetical protein
MRSKRDQQCTDLDVMISPFGIPYLFTIQFKKTKPKNRPKIQFIDPHSI